VGGAGIAARQLNQSLVGIGIDSKLLSLGQSDVYDGEIESIVHVSRVHKLVSKSTTAGNLLLGNPFFSLFSIAAPMDSLSSFLGERSVIHVHNFYNLVSHEQLLSFLSDGHSLVVTLHDERFFTAGCHLTMDCQGFTSNCESCPRLASGMNGLLRRPLHQMSMWKHFSERVAIVCPSMWMQNQFMKSPLASIFRCYVSSNVLDIRGTQNFRYRFVTDSAVVGFPADFSNIMKGGKMARNISEYLAAGNSQVVIKTPEHFDYDMESFWRDIDCLFLPTLMDNSPNVITEAHLRGIPVLGSTVGGVSECLLPDFDLGFDVTIFDFERFLKSIFTIRSNYDKSSAILGRDLALSRIKDGLDRYMSIYVDVMNR